jgi:hypothetical protein
MVDPLYTFRLPRTDHLPCLVVLSCSHFTGTVLTNTVLAVANPLELVYDADTNNHAWPSETVNGDLTERPKNCQAVSGGEAISK